MLLEISGRHERLLGTKYCRLDFAGLSAGRQKRCDRCLSTQLGVNDPVTRYFRWRPDHSFHGPSTGIRLMKLFHYRIQGPFRYRAAATASRTRRATWCMPVHPSSRQDAPPQRHTITSRATSRGNGTAETVTTGCLSVADGERHNR
jgi:hypothetical protein